MSSKLTSWLGAGALTGALAMAASGWAMGPPQGMGSGDEAGPDPARMIARMTDRLGLSDEQKTQVENIMSSAQEAGAKDRQRMQELRAEMMAMKGNFDAARARTIANEIGQITAGMVFRASETFSRVYGLLNDQQRAQLDEMMARRAEHRQKWRDTDKGKPD